MKTKRPILAEPTQAYTMAGGIVRDYIVFANNVPKLCLATPLTLDVLNIAGYTEPF